MAVNLFAGMPVTDLARAVDWYERFLGAPPSFRPDDTEAVWDVVENAYVYVDVRPATAGSAMQTLFVEDFDARLAALAARGIVPDEQETYGNGVRKAIFHDPDGNEFGIGGPPAG